MPKTGQQEPQQTAAGFNPMWIVVGLALVAVVMLGFYLFGQKPVQAPVATAPSISAPAPTTKEQAPAAPVAQADDITFTVASETGVTMRFPILGAQFDESPGNLAGIVEQVDDNPTRKGRKVWVLNYEDNPQAFNGVQIYALATRNFWPGGKELRDLNLRSPKIPGKATIGQSKFVDLAMRTLPGPFQIRVWVIEFPNLKDAQGKPLRAWGFHPMGSYMVENLYREPQTAYKVVKDGATWKAEAPGDAGKAYAAQSK